MQISELSTNSQAATDSNTPQSASAKGASDFNTFLKLLTAQMRNQDPLKPMDSTEFVAQLASFSSVEQQIETNNKLTELLGVFSNRSTTNLTDWLGKEVRREGSANFSGQTVEIEVPVTANTDGARLVIRNGSNEIVYSKQIAPSARSVLWDGTTLNSSIAPFGQYSFDVEKYSGDELLGVESGSVFDLVTEVRFDHGGTILVFGDGGALNADAVTAIRAPQHLEIDNI